ncbi:MAG TPA: efflux RND transporter periplasmic adaptor subunit [Roseimicrobium sp.]|nr:efflux RND transporter periplasmic adaptor subunit [Roseimicrobium sp.]
MNPQEPKSLHDLEHAKPQHDFATAPRERVRLWPLGIVIILITVVAVVFGYLPRARASAQLKADTRELAVPAVHYATVQEASTASALSLSAEVKPFVESPIYARASGYLKKWHVDLGAKVKAGQLLAEIDTPELNQQLAQAKAEVAQAEAALALAKTTAARWASLLKSASVSEQESAEKQADLALKIATLDASRANVRRLENLQGFSKVTAPFDGVITARKTDVGALVSETAGRELFHLAQIQTLRVYVRVPQSFARGIVAGLTGVLTVPDLPGRTYPAQVVRMSGSMDIESRTLLTELEVDNSKGEILAGSYAQIRFDSVKQVSALTLPANTLLYRSEGPQVAIIAGDGKLTMRTIKLGRDLGRTVEILEGVKPGEHIVMNPLDSFETGRIVRVVESEEKK